MNNFLTWNSFRKFLNDIHLWVGLVSGIFVLIICLSGTIYVFNTEIREFSRPEVFHLESTENATKLPLEELVNILSRETGGKVVSLKIPADLEKSYILTVKKLEENNPSEKNADKKEKLAEGSKEKSNSSRGIQYMVNPYTGQILGNSNEKTAITEFMQLMFSLHRWLLLDRIEEPIFGELPNRTLGSYISGTATILFTLGVITGMVIWFPRKIRSWKNGLKVKWDGNWKRVNHDLHNSLGFYSCILLFLMGITGPQWSFPWYREALRKTLGTYQPEGALKPETPHSVIQGTGSAKTLFIEDFISAANKTLNYTGDLTIVLAADSADAIVVNKVKTGFFAPVASDKIYLDQYTASVLHSDIFKAKPLNERISASIKALHVGDVYGSFSKILYFLACLIATSLPVTGTLIWLNKMKKG
ncbi:PepSY-associated TM helix domain-containing protein [Daejeonella sp.]|jgi:uncharacterized iron-regulated membrane protein|uniref:PepSY-associated TM helix domain-containing protein n=1 Tax=Daejeonella sp. TaxID=2805397 RepID=UPI0037844B1A